MDTELSQQAPTQVAFIFNNVANYAQLVVAFHDGVEVHVLDAAQDGLGQIAAILEGRSGIEALHVIGHGAKGSLDLGSVTLNNATIGSHGEVLGRIGSALKPDGDILLYGCDVGADALGAQFVGAIAQATGADVAASTDKTGGVQLGGNWTLEHRTGLVAAGGALQISAISSLDTLLAPVVKDVTDSSQKSPGIFVPGFTLTTSEAVQADPEAAVDGIYFNKSGKTASFTITADGSSVGSFDLTGMTFLKLLDAYPHYRITITGHKANGGTATAMIEFAEGSRAPATPDNFSDMTGLTSFDVTINVVTVQGGDAYDLTLDAFTVDNVTAPAPGTPDLQTGNDLGLNNADNITSASAVGFTGNGVTGASVLVFIDKNGNGVYDAGTDVSSTTTASGGAWTVSGLATVGLNGSYKVYAQQTIDGSVSGLSAALDVTIDRTAPSLAITSNRSTLKTGETATVTFTFSEDPGTSFVAGDIVVSGGTLSGLTTTGAVRTAIFTPTGNTNSGTASITVASGNYTDTAGNNGGAGATPSLTFDTRAPTVTVSSSSTSLLVGQTATITFTFSEDPGLSFTWNGSSGDVSVTGGTLSAVSGSGTTRTATFTADGSNATAGIQVHAGSYADTAGNMGAGGASPAITVTLDSTPPAAPSTPDLVSASDIGHSDSDNITNDTTPSFTGTAEAGATVRLYDGATQVGSGTADGAGNWTITTSALTVGAHSITAVATDAAGNTGTASTALNIIIDTSPPTLAITSDKATLKGGETATITFTFSQNPGASFDLADVTVTGGTLSALGGTGSVRTATFTPTANTNGGSASITVAGGAYTDTAGNPGGAGSTPALTFDTRTPTLAITSNKPSLAIGETATITFTFSEDPGASFDLADVSISGGALSALSGTGLVRTATFTPAANTNGGNALIGVPGGAFTDAAGNSGGAASVAFAYDTLAPSAPSALVLDAASDTGLSDSDHLTRDTTPTVSGSAEAGATVRLYDDVTEVGSTTADGAGKWSITSSALTAGTHSLTAVATDAAGNTGAASSALSVSIDTSQPTLAITSNKASLKGGETATITLTFSEDPGASFGAGDITVSGGTLGELSGTGLTRTATFTPNTNTNGGVASITVAGGTYTDAAGNLGGAGGTPALAFDTLAPTLAITSSKANLAIGETATISFTFSEDPGASFTLADISATGGTLSALGGTGLVRTASFTPAANTNGGNAIIGVAGGAYADAAGNAGASGSLAIAFDTLAPSAPSAPVLEADSDTGLSASDQITNDTTPTVSGTAETGATIKLYDGANEVGSTTADGSGNWTITTSALSAGAHSITAVATDAAGNTGAASSALSMTIDTSLPTLAISSDRASLKGGETAVITFTFSEDPGASFGNGDIVVLGGALGALSGTGLVRTATFTPDAGSSGNASITVAAGAYVDAAGNLGGAGTTPALSFDTQAPTLAITSDKASLKGGESATISFAFSEDPGASFTLADISVTGGALSPLSGTGLVRTATFTPAANTNGGNASIGVTGGAYADAAGNGGAAGSVALAFDTLAPSAPSALVLAAGSDTGLSASDQLTNDTTPIVSGIAEAGATIKLYDGANEVGSTTADGSGNWSITSSALSAGAHGFTAVARDAAGNASAASSTLSVNIDTSLPTLAISSEKASLKGGETAIITFTFSEDPGTSFSLPDIVVSGGTLGELSGSGSTRTATFTPAAGSGGNASITVAGGSYTDAAGNLGGAGTTPTLSFDTQAPKLAITSDKASLKGGESATITFTFSEDPGASFTRADIKVAGGSLGELAGSGTTRTALFTPNPDVNGGSASITVDAGAYTDPIGNAGAAAAGPAIAFDTLAPAASTPDLAADSDHGVSSSDNLTSDATPTFSGAAEDGATVTLYDGATVIGTTVASAGTWTITSSALSDGAYAISTVVRDAAGNASAPSSALDVTIDTVAPAQATLSLVEDSGVNGDAITSKGSVRVDGIAAGAQWEYSLDAGASWVAGAGTEMVLSQDGQHQVVVRQTDAAGNSVASTPFAFQLDRAGPAATVAISDNALSSGETAIVTISFSEAVAGFTLSDISASSGTLGGLSSADGGRTWTATFTPAVDTDSAGNTIKVSTAGVTDIAGNPGSGVSESGNYAVLTRALGLSARIDISDSDLKAGEQAQVTITFSEAVTRFTRADLNTPNAQLSNLSSANGGTTWTALLTPNSSVNDASNVITLDLGGVLGNGGVPGTGSASSANYAVNTMRPTASMEIASRTLTQGASTELTIRFSEAVTGFDLADISCSAGSISDLSSSDGITWTATLTADSGLKPASVGFVTLNVAGVQNAAGNSGAGKASAKPYVVLPANAAPTRVDGVDTYIQPISTSTGAPGQLLVIPATSGDRKDDPATPNSTLADIPLAASGQAGGASLHAGLPAGIGLQAEGPSLPLNRSQALQDLIDRIESRTESGSASQQEMSGQGTSFLAALGDSAMVRTQTIVLTSDSLPGSGAPITITGAALSAGSVVGLVIDGAAMPSGSTVQLDNVQFAAVVGDLRVIGGAGRNIVVGDGGRQTIFLGEDDDVLSGGGGDDIIGSAGGDDVLDGGSGNDLVAGGVGKDNLKGGSGDDILNGGRSVKGEWSFFLSASGAISARHLDAPLTLTGSELVQAAEFDRANPELAFLGAKAQQLEGVALLYTAFGRAPDLAGLSFWSRAGVSLRDVADGILRSSEWAATPLSQAGNDAFLHGLYQDMLGRAVDQSGRAFWMEHLSTGAATRSDVLMALAFSAEHRARALTKEGYVIGQESLVQERGWLSSSGDDRLEGGGGNDQLVGGDGFDTAVFAAARHNYRILVGEDGTVRVADDIDRTVDTLSGIEAAEFGDGKLDLSFLAQDPALLGATGLLYQAVLDRPADAAGLKWWLGQGLQAEKLAHGFASSAEFQARYGAMGDAEFVRALYANSGLEASAAGGMVAWENYLDSHSRAELVAAWIVADSVLAAHYGSHGIWLL